MCHTARQRNNPPFAQKLKVFVCCVGRSSKGETLEGVISQDFGPRILGWERRLGHGPELAQRMMNEGDGGSLGWGNGPTAAQEVDLVVGLDPAAQVERQMQVQQGGMAGKDAGPCAAPPRLCAKRHCD